MAKKLGTSKTTESVYVGKERYAIIEQAARRISHITNYTVKPSAVIHHIIENEIGRVEEEMIKRINSVKKESLMIGGGSE